MVLVPVCVDWIAPAHPVQAIEESVVCVLQPIDDGQRRLSMLAACRDWFAGAYPAHATRRMIGGGLADVKGLPGALTGKICDSVNTTAESTYELASDFMLARRFAGMRSFDRPAIAGSRRDFPGEYWQRVVEFSSVATSFQWACGEKARLVTSKGSSAFAIPTQGESLCSFGDRRLIDELRNRAPRTRMYS